jgi:hypothetical protein
MSVCNEFCIHASFLAVALATIGGIGVEPDGVANFLAPFFVPEADDAELTRRGRGVEAETEAAFPLARWRLSASSSAFFPIARLIQAIVTGPQFDIIAQLETLPAALPDHYW